MEPHWSSANFETNQSHIALSLKLQADDYNDMRQHEMLRFEPIVIC